jgi:hypothetical protein
VVSSSAVPVSTRPTTPTTLPLPMPDAKVRA